MHKFIVYHSWPYACDVVLNFSTDYIGVNLESQISAEVKKHLDEYGGPRTSLGSQQPDDAQGLEDYENQQGTS